MCRGSRILVILFPVPPVSCIVRYTDNNKSSTSIIKPVNEKGSSGLAGSALVASKALPGSPILIIGSAIYGAPLYWEDDDAVDAVIAFISVRRLAHR